MNTSDKSSNKRSVLFLDKVFLRGKKHAAITGAERFNLQLIGQLQEQGISLTIPAASSWAEDIKSIADRGDLTYIRLLDCFSVAWPNAVLTNLFLFSRKFDKMILGNVARNLVFTVRLLHKLKCFSDVLLLAHREPSSIFLKTLKDIPLSIIAVNSQIASHFIKAGFRQTNTYFGEIRADLFHQKKRIDSDDDLTKNGKINFCVFGNLNPEWKGSDLAIEAVGKLPEGIRQQIHLHLAGFSGKLPRLTDSIITAYPWIKQQDVTSFLHKMDVMLVPSRDTSVMKETFSQASVQGMLCGLPLIVNNIPILTEKVNQGGGLVFRDISELSAHIETLSLDSSLRTKLGKEASEIARSRFVWDTQYFVENFLFPKGLNNEVSPNMMDTHQANSHEANY